VKNRKRKESKKRKIKSALKNNEAGKKQVRVTAQLHFQFF
jgi:hypothetical protein